MALRASEIDVAALSCDQRLSTVTLVASVIIRGGSCASSRASVCCCLRLGLSYILVGRSVSFGVNR